MHEGDGDGWVDGGRHSFFEREVLIRDMRKMGNWEEGVSFMGRVYPKSARTATTAEQGKGDGVFVQESFPDDQTGRKKLKIHSLSLQVCLREGSKGSPESTKGIFEDVPRDD